METINGVKHVEEGTSQRFYVYILKGSKDWHYCGITNNILRRYIEHNQGKSISTKKHSPYVLRWMKEVRTRQQARFIEVMIKRKGVRRYLTKQQYTTSMGSVMSKIEGIMYQYQHHIRNK